MQVVHFPIELCIVSTYDTFARKNKDTHWGILVFYMIMGFERPLRKQSSGLFLGRGRIHGKQTALRKECWRLFIFRCIGLVDCALHQLIVAFVQISDFR